MDELIEALKSIQESDSLFLVEIITAALTDEHPRYNLRDIRIALEKSGSWNIIDPLHLVPLLLCVPDDNAAELIHLVVQNANPKECLIAIQEAIENLDHISEKEGSIELSVTEQLIRLLDATSDCITRLQLRKRGPAETLHPIFKHLGSAIEVVSLQTDKLEGRRILEKSTRLVSSASNWACDIVKWDKLESPSVSDILLHFISSVLGNLSSKICSSLAERRFAMYYPKLVFNYHISEDALKGAEIMESFLSTAKKLGLSKFLNSPPYSMGQLILSAHEDATFISTSNANIERLLPFLISSLKQNTAVDEVLTLLLTLVCTCPDTLTTDIIDSLATTLTPFSASHPDPVMRHISFRILSATLGRSPAPLRLAHLTSLLECSFTQMRVAAVGLVKEAFISAAETTSSQSLFNSPSLIRAVGPILFRPDPPDILEKPSRKSLEKFIESSESVRLTECLSFYYVWLIRDTKNLTGIRDRDRIASIEQGLLRPLRNALSIWLQDSTTSQDPHMLMALASLEISIERVDSAILRISL